jgi:hypothetical protein
MTSIFQNTCHGMLAVKLTVKQGQKTIQTIQKEMKPIQIAAFQH